MKVNFKYLPLILGATLAAGVLLGSVIQLPGSNRLSSKTNSKAKLNKLIDFIEPNMLMKSIPIRL